MSFKLYNDQICIILDENDKVIRKIKFVDKVPDYLKNEAFRSIFDEESFKMSTTSNDIVTYPNVYIPIMLYRTHFVSICKLLMGSNLVVVKINDVDVDTLNQYKDDLNINNKYNQMNDDSLNTRFVLTGNNMTVGDNTYVMKVTSGYTNDMITTYNAYVEACTRVIRYESLLTKPITLPNNIQLISLTVSVLNPFTKNYTLRLLELFNEISCLPSVGVKDTSIRPRSSKYVYCDESKCSKYCKPTRLEFQSYILDDDAVDNKRVKYIKIHKSRSSLAVNNIWRETKRAFNSLTFYYLKPVTEDIMLECVELRANGCMELTFVLIGTTISSSSDYNKIAKQIKDHVNDIVIDLYKCYAILTKGEMNDFKSINVDKYVDIYKFTTSVTLPPSDNVDVNSFIEMFLFSNTRPNFGSKSTTSIPIPPIESLGWINYHQYIYTIYGLESERSLRNDLYPRYHILANEDNVTFTLQNFDTIDNAMLYYTLAMSMLSIDDKLLNESDKSIFEKYRNLVLSKPQLKYMMRVDPNLFGKRFVRGKLKLYSALAQQIESRVAIITKQEYEQLRKEYPNRVDELINQTYDIPLYIMCPFDSTSVINYHRYDKQLCIPKCTMTLSNPIQYHSCRDSLSKNSDEELSEVEMSPSYVFKYMSHAIVGRYYNLPVEITCYPHVILKCIDSNDDIENAIVLFRNADLSKYRVSIPSYRYYVKLMDLINNKDIKGIINYVNTSVPLIIDELSNRIFSFHDENVKGSPIFVKDLEGMNELIIDVLQFNEKHRLLKVIDEIKNKDVVNIIDDRLTDEDDQVVTSWGYLIDNNLLYQLPEEVIRQSNMIKLSTICNNIIDYNQQYKLHNGPPIDVRWLYEHNPSRFHIYEVKEIDNKLLSNLITMWSYDHKRTIQMDANHEYRSKQAFK